MPVRIKTALLLAACILLISIAQADTMTVEYYCMSLCELCDPQAEFAARFEALTGTSADNIQPIIYNVYEESGKKAYDEVCEHLPAEQRKLPLLLLDGVAYAGDTSIDTALTDTFGKRDDRTSVIYFLETTACESCAAAEKIVDQLPAVVAVYEQGMLQSSPIEVRKVHVVNDYALTAALFDAYHVPNGERTVPCVLFGNTYLSGLSDNETELLPRIKKGEALHTSMPESLESLQETQPMGILTAVAAGLTAGFNPCAVSMLLFFLGLLLSAKTKPLVPGLCYLLGKLITYLCLSLLVFQLWSQYAPDWFPTAAKLTLTALGSILVFMNVMDAVNVRQARYGKVVNQLPEGLRGRLRKLIGKATHWGRLGVGLAALIVGIVAAAGEFLCAGQLYIAVLMNQAQTHMALIPLIAYILSFLLPSAVVLVLVALSRRTLDAADWMLKHMFGIKLATAAVMLCLMLSAWL